jgi:hypothetical protein
MQPLTSELGQSEKSGRSTGKSALPPTPDMALHPRKLTLCAMKRHGLHVIITAVIVESSVNSSADRSHDGAPGDNNSTWGDNDRACSDAARPVYAGRADDGACFRCSGVKSVGVSFPLGMRKAYQECYRRG